MPLEVRIVTPEREVWHGEASVVVARGVEGEVGILPGHAPMLIRLAIGHLRVRREGTEDLRAAVDGGFLHVSSEGGRTRVDVLASQALLASEVDLGREMARKEELERRLAERDDAEARAELAKALARISLAG